MASPPRPPRPGTLSELSPAVRRLVARFGLEPHPEGGFYREVYRDDLAFVHPGIPEGAGGSAGRERSASTAIYFLLPEGEISAFHRVLWTDEVWHLYAGGPLELHLIHEDGGYERRLLSGDPEAADPAGGPMAVVEAGCWQAARPAPGAGYAFGGCTVAPGFDFADFELPAAEALVAEFPAHEAAIRALTRS